MSCREVRDWLHRDTESLGEAERLVLEDHLAGCERCRSDRDQLLRVVRIASALPARSIGPRGHQRVIARALLEGSPPVRSPRRSLPWFAFAAGGALAAAAALLVIVFSRSDGAASAPPLPDVATPSEHVSALPARAIEQVAPVPGAHEAEVAVVDGTLVHAHVALARDASVPANVTLRAATEVRLRAHSVAVVIAASSEIRHSSVDRSIILERGRIELDGKSSRTIAELFTVEGDGRVIVTPKRVTVSRGTARVLSPDGTLLAVVGAGQSWDLSDSRSAKRSAGALIEQARAAFVAHDYSAAERRADAALDATPTRRQAAEARTILAECAQVTGRLDDALARYQVIATRFADLPAGETALFAAARLEASRRHASAAQALYQRYLDRYPEGRFADDARRQLRAP